MDEVDRKKLFGGGGMIEHRFNGLYVLTCDICGEEVAEAFEDFSEAVQYKKDEGWKNLKH